MNLVRHSLAQLVLPIFVFAVPMIRIASAQFVDPLNSGGDLNTLLDTIVEVVIYISFPIIVLMLVYTGFLFVQAQGNPAKLSEARKVFVWTLIGAFIILAAQTLKTVIVDTVAEISSG